MNVSQISAAAMRGDTAAEALRVAEERQTRLHSIHAGVQAALKAHRNHEAAVQELQRLERRLQGSGM